MDATCSSPEGFTVSYPDSWETNEGGVIAECTRFDPQSFSVSAGTDERVAAINVNVENTDFSTVTSSIDQETVRHSEQRSIDGRQAVRIEQESAGEGIIPEGTSTTSYYIDLGPRSGDTGRVLVANTLDYTDIDYEQARRVLDRMVSTLDIDTEADAGVDPVGDYTTPPVTSPGYPTSGDPVWLTDVRFGVHDGFERVAFEFANTGDLSYSVENVDESVPASGDPIEVAGNNILEVTMTPASGVDLSGDEPNTTYQGSERIDVSGDLVTELVQVEDFENVLTWAVGVNESASVAVTTVEDPHRLVVDIANR